jgi:hypothetical protein
MQNCVTAGAVSSMLTVTGPDSPTGMRIAEMGLHTVPSVEPSTVTCCGRMRPLHRNVTRFSFMAVPPAMAARHDDTLGLSVEHQPLR